MRNLDENGNIAEPASANWEKPPDTDTEKEKKLLRWGWLYLLMPVAGIVPYSQVRNELTDRWGHYPWWL